MAGKQRDRTRMAILLCAGMLIICLLALVQYLMPVLNGDSEPQGAAFGMMLIDIADEQTAASYHVESCGVYVLAVQPESPAADAGVLTGDLLLKVNGVSVQDTANFVAMQEAFAPDQQVQMEFQRGNGSDVYVAVLVWNEN